MYGKEEEYNISITMGNIEDDFESSLARLHQWRNLEKDKFQQEIMDKIERSLRECRAFGTDKKYSKMYGSITRAISSSKNAREVAIKITDIMAEAQIHGEFELRLLDIGTSFLAQNEKEIQKIQKIALRLQKEKKELETKYRRLITLIMCLLMVGLLLWKMCQQ